MAERMFEISAINTRPDNGTFPYMVLEHFTEGMAKGVPESCKAKWVTRSAVICFLAGPNRIIKGFPHGEETMVKMASNKALLATTCDWIWPPTTEAFWRITLRYATPREKNF